MDYIVDFGIGSALYLSVLTYFYFRERKAPSKRQKLYQWLLLTGFCALALDVTCALVEKLSLACPSWLYFIDNFLFLFCTQINGPLFLFYVLMLTGVYRNTRRRYHFLMVLPMLLIVVLLVMSAFGTHGIFYIDQNNIYHHGETHIALYVVMALYIIGSTTVMLLRHGRIQPKKEYTIYAFVVITLVVMGVQLALPRYLVNSTATALAMTMMYYALQPPGEQIDPMTGAINRIGFQQLLAEMTEQRQDFTILVFPVQAVRYINRGMGFAAGDALLCQFADCLGRVFPDKRLARVGGATFAVLGAKKHEALDTDILRALRQEVQNAVDVGVELSPRVLAGGYRAAAKDTPDGVLRIVDKLGEELISGCPEQVLFADESFRTRIEYNSQAEAALERAVSDAGGGLTVYFQPINRPDGSLAAMEALCRLSDPRLGQIPPDLFVTIAERNGRIHMLGDAVLRRVCEFVRDNDIAAWGLEHVGVNLSAAQCMREGFAERTIELVRSYGIPEGLLAFELTETAAMTELPAVVKNMNALSSAGFGLLLDDFGSGFANFDYICKLPFTCVKLDKTLLWLAEKDPGQMTLLRGVCRVVSDMGLPRICEGVETAQQAELLESLGVTRYQGYYFARPMPGEKLLEYAAQHRGEATV